MSASSDFNLFVLLELDPDEEWSQEKFERRLREKRSRWSSDTNSSRPEKASTAKRNLERYEDLKRVAASGGDRDKHAAESREIRKSERGALLEKLEHALELLQGKGSLLDSELDDIVKQYGEIASEMEIRSRVKVPIVSSANHVDTNRDVIESTKAREIQEKLDFLGKRNLYEFLGLGAQTQPVQLVAKANSIYDKSQNSGNKNVVGTLTASLAGECRALFSSAEAKRRYDNTLEEKKLRELKENLDLIAGKSKTISAAQIKMLLEELRQTSEIPTETAQAVIREYSRSRGYAVEIDLGVVEHIRTVQKCGYCDELNEQSEICCTNCGEPLKEPCPRCGETVRTEQGACGDCGFPSGNRGLVKELCTEIGDAYANRDYAYGIKLLQQAASAWPGVAKGTLAERVRSLNELVLSALAEQKAALAELRKAVSGRRLYAARTLLDHAAALYPTTSQEIAELRGRIEASLRTVAAQLLTARSYRESDTEGQVQAFQKVLETCSDCQEALDGLARTPPAAPTAADAMVGGKVIQLTWKPSPSKGISHIVVRKAWSRPVSAADGTRIGTVAGSSFDDTAPEIGVPTYYGIFADRGGVPSREGAVLRTPVQIVEEVQQLTPRIGDRRVVLTWKAPPNLFGVIVRRADRSYPKTLDEGNQVPVVGDGQAVDAGLQNDNKYYYTVFAQFKGPDGGVITSPGVHLEVVPQEPPEPVRELQVSVEGQVEDRKIRLRWPAPRRGEVAVFGADKPFGVRCGDVVPRASLTEYGIPLSSQDLDATDRMTGAGFRYYLPVTVFQDAAYIGQEQRYVCVDEADGLTCQNLGNALRLQWNWPPGCNEVIVGQSCRTWPQPDGNGSTCIPLTKAQYDLRGYFDIPNPSQVDYYVAIFAVYSQAGQRVISAGACRRKITVRNKVEVSYEIAKPWLGAGLKLVLNVSGSGGVPAMILVRKQRELPMSKGAGEVVFRVAPIPPGTRRVVIKLPQSLRTPQSFALLFLEDDSGYDFVTLRKPAREKLQLF